MATAPIKSQPLHNFSLSHLRWAHKTHPSQSSRISRKASFISLTKDEDNLVVEEEREETGKNEQEKPWKLRPRKVVERLQEETVRNNNESVVVGLGCGMTERQQRKQKVALEEEEKKKNKIKKKLWISLSKEEIEEDVYSLTGSRPSRRPKKRPRNIQKQLDNVFPGLYLVGMSVDAYRGHDSSLR